MDVSEALPAINAEAEFKAIWQALSALKGGDAAVRLPIDWTGPAARVAGEFNELATRLDRLSHEARIIDRDAAASASPARRLAQKELSGFWLDWTAAVNGFVDRGEDHFDRFVVRS